MPRPSTAALLLWAAATVLTGHHLENGDFHAAAWTLWVATAAVCVYIYAKGDPRMSKGRTRFKLQELRQTAAEKTGDTIEIEVEDGTVFTFPAPGFWDDEVKEAFTGNNDVTGVKRLLGPREYLKFRQCGGRADDVALALKQFAEEQGLTVGESSASQTS